MIYFKKLNSKNEVIAKSSDYCVNDHFRERAIKRKDGDLILVIEDKDLLRSSRLFGKLSKLAYDIFDAVHGYYQDAYLAQSHTLKKIQGQLRQKIDGIIEHPLLGQAENYEQRKQLIISAISAKPEVVADTLIYLQKRVFELGAHMSSFEILHMGEQININKSRHNIRRLILNVWHGFDQIFEEKRIKYHFYFEDGVAEENKCLLDYKTINAALYNIFDNAAKYSMPGSEVRFYYDIHDGNLCLKISTLSLPIEADELPRLCDLGFRGRNCSGIEGSGVGLYIVKKALDLNDLRLSIRIEDQSGREYEGRLYKENIFEIKGSLPE